MSLLYQKLSSLQSHGSTTLLKYLIAKIIRSAMKSLAACDPLDILSHIFLLAGELIDKRDVWRKAAQVIDQQVLSALRHTVMT